MAVLMAAQVGSRRAAWWPGIRWSCPDIADDPTLKAPAKEQVMTDGSPPSNTS